MRASLDNTIKFFYFFKVAISSSSAGINFLYLLNRSDILITVGKVSFEL